MKVGKNQPAKLSVSDRAKLLMTKVEILKLKAVNSGYDWAHTPATDREALEAAVREIDVLIATHNETCGDAEGA